MKPMARFQDNVVILSGATGGFGRRTAQRLSEEGARLVLTDIDRESLDELAAGLPGQTTTMAGDVTDEALHRDLVALALSQFGRLDTAINNAGIAHPLTRFDRIEADLARNVIEVDLIGVFLAMKHQLGAMEKQFRAEGRGGAIVNIASVAGIAGAPRLSAYAAAKHGVVGLTRSAAAEFAGKGIRVNAVCPSYDALGMIAPDPETAEAELTRGVPMRRLAEVDEIVEVILFAADPANSFMTGQTIAADGGITAI
jgi:NAD(P)-dependent dehydrogenase (short-subunit alcohol dehydrogenase family)